MTHANFLLKLETFIAFNFFPNAFFITLEAPIDITLQVIALTLLVRVNEGLNKPKTDP